MAKINEKLKEKLDKFNKDVENTKRQKVKVEKFTPTKNLESDISQNTKRMSIFTNPKSYKVSMNEFRQSGVSDNGFNQDTLDNNIILYNSDMKSTKQEIQAIKTRLKDPTKANTKQKIK